MSRFRVLRHSGATTVLAIGLLTCSFDVLPQEKPDAPPEPGSVEPPEKKPLDDNADLLMFRCATFLDAVEMAKVDDKSTDQQRKNATEAQDAIVDVLLWTNGYLTNPRI